jgi:hypothetical protein
MRFLISLITDTFPYFPNSRKTFPFLTQIVHNTVSGRSIWPLIYKLPFSTFPRLFRSLVSCRQQPRFKILQKQPRTGRRQFWKHPSSPVPSSFQTPTKIVTQTFIDLSLHCYHCRKTQQLRAGKGHTSERPVSTCLIFVNFLKNLAQNFISVLGLHCFFLQKNAAEPCWEKSHKRETKVSSCLYLHLHFF